MPFDFLKQALAKKKASATSKENRQTSSAPNSLGGHNQVSTKKPQKKSAGRGR